MSERTYCILRVYPLENMVLGVLFENGVFKKYDMAQLIPEIPDFKRLEDRKLFEMAKPDYGGSAVVWDSELDLSEYELYKNGTEWKDPPENDYYISEIVANLRELRQKAHITQKELARRTGIKQPCIARMENGGRVPNIATLIKLGRALGYNLYWGKKA